MSISLSTRSPDMPPRILFIDDDADVQKAAAMLLPRRGFSLRSAHSPEEAWSLLAEAPADVVLLDLNFRPGSSSGAEGLACLERLIGHDPEAVVVVVTGHSGVSIAVAAMRAGATDFIMKPWNNDRLVATLNNAVAERHRRRQAPSGDFERAEGDAPIIGESAGFRHIMDLLHRAAPTGASMLLTGEVGTGKTILARAIHRLSPTAGLALQVLRPAASGWTEDNNPPPSGTLLIEAVETWPEPRRVELLDLVTRHSGVRLITTSRAPRHVLKDLLQADLLYRLSTVELPIPPLRARGGDVRLLAEHALRLFSRRHGRGNMRLSEDALASLAAGPIPDNVRGLFQVVERAVVLSCEAVLTAADIPLSPHLPEEASAVEADGNDLNLARSEKVVVQAALRRHGFNVSHAARELGLSRAALYRRMARHGL